MPGSTPPTSRASPSSSICSRRGVRPRRRRRDGSALRHREVIGTPGGDIIAGNDGANALTAGGGSDVLTGRGGADRFIYDQVNDSPRGGGDFITDFNPAEHDRLDLSDIDANEQAGGNQAFQFIGDGAFTGAGQLRFFLADGHTYLEANTTDATAGAEMAIRLEMQVTPHAADFVL